MNRLSSHNSEMKSTYDVIVVGSGYGGSIAASRMSRIGLRVCMLEKGKEFSPGDFPNNLAKATKEMNFGKGSREKKNGLYELVLGNGIGVFKGCGLGGTSLVNANVSIEPEPRVFEDKKWPKAIRDTMPSFYEGVKRAKDMLKPTPYPEGSNGYPVLDKTNAMRDSASGMDAEFRLLNINVTFEDKVNHVGVKQPKCNNCGDCVTGCNYGSKNTTNMNYIPDAKNYGAEIYTNIGVSHVEKKGDDWLVFYKVYNVGREKFNNPLMFVKAKRVFISAGSLGSTEILFKSQQNGLPLSNQLGRRFTGNGDVLGFAYNNDREINGIGLGKKEIEDIANVGPCITSIIDLRHKPDLDQGMTLEEGTFPGPIASVLAKTIPVISHAYAKDTDRGIWDYIQEKWRDIISFFFGAYRGALENSQVYLVMTHDDGDGEMILDGDQLELNWKDVGKQKIFEKVNQTMYNATVPLGGAYMKNPAWTKTFDYNLVTVHPLGGCVMGDDASTGVVNHMGEVFSGNEGSDLHKGLFVMDGAIVPRPLGTNPLLTISALAERNCKLIAEADDKNLDYEYTRQLDANISQVKGVQFTECMTGYFSKNEKTDYKKGHDLGKSENSDLEFVLTIEANDVDRFVDDPDHGATMFGHVTASGLSSKALAVNNGNFNLFVDQNEEGSFKKMKYEMVLNSVEGRQFYFQGFKRVQNDKSLDVWKDTTTLFVTIYDGNNSNAEVLGKGMLKIEVADFMKQLTTMKTTNTKGIDISGINKFGKLFAGNLWDVYLKKHN